MQWFFHTVCNGWDNIDKQGNFPQDLKFLAAIGSTNDINIGFLMMSQVKLLALLDLVDFKENDDMKTRKDISLTKLAQTLSSYNVENIWTLKMV